MFESTYAPVGERPSSASHTATRRKRGDGNWYRSIGLFASLLIAGCGAPARNSIDLKDEISQPAEAPVEAGNSELPFTQAAARSSIASPDTRNSVSILPQPSPKAATRDAGTAARAEAIIRLSEDEIPPSLEQYRDALIASDRELRSAALDALASAATDAAMNILDAEFANFDARTQHLILDTYAEVGSNYAIELLRQRLTDPNVEIRNRAADYLSEIEELSGSER
jgi:hypothetical protein